MTQEPTTDELTLDGKHRRRRVEYDHNTGYYLIYTGGKLFTSTKDEAFVIRQLKTPLPPITDRDKVIIQNNENIQQENERLRGFVQGIIDTPEGFRLPIMDLIKEAEKSLTPTEPKETV